MILVLACLPCHVINEADARVVVFALLALGMPVEALCWWERRSS